jgi:pimeloyl-ACP methyl ester carboxylesterase
LVGRSAGRTVDGRHGRAYLIATMIKTRFYRRAVQRHVTLAITLAMLVALVACAAEDKKAKAQSERGILQGSDEVGVVTKTQVDADQAASGPIGLTGTAACDVVVKSISYASTTPDDSSAQLSAALLVPGGVTCPGPFTIIAYAHATSRDRSRTLAALDDAETRLLVNVFASRGYLVVATDYLGYGKSNFPYHPYLDAKSEASSVIDSIRAARSAAVAAGVPLTGRVLLAGYSQGGHSTLAAHRAIEQGGAPDIAVSASGAMSGPYDLALTFKENLRLLPGVNDDRVTQSTSASFSFNSAIADKLTGFASDGTLADALRRQSVTGWASAAPVVLCGGTRDSTVTFANAALAAGNLRGKNAPITVVDVDSEPAYVSFVPTASTPAAELTSYHSKTVPPLCFQVIRDRLFVQFR